MINPYLTNGLSHHYHLDESTFNFRDFMCDLKVWFHLEATPMGRLTSKPSSDVVCLLLLA